MKPTAPKVALSPTRHVIKPRVFSIMSSLLKFIGSSLVALIAAGSLSAAELEIGRAFPDLKGYALEGALPDRNDKVLLLDFWATWCGPCKSSFPVYNSLQKEFSAQGFT